MKKKRLRNGLLLPRRVTLQKGSGVPLGDKDLKNLAKQLKRKCGTGGTIKSGVIEIQGDHRDLLKKELSKLGYTVKLSGD